MRNAMDDVTRACAHVRELMLEADPAELRGSGSPVVAAHVRECGQCRLLAERMLSAHQQLDDALSTLTGQHAAAPALTMRSRRDRTRSLLSARAARVFAPLAAAAVLVLMLYQQRTPDDLPSLEPMADVVALADGAPVVNVTSGDDVAIMSTTNPSITVIWYLKRER